MAPINETIPFNTTTPQSLFHGVSFRNALLIPLSIFGVLSFLVLIVLSIWFFFRGSKGAESRPRRILRAFRVGKMRTRDKRFRIREMMRRRREKKRRTPPPLKFGFVNFLPEHLPVLFHRQSLVPPLGSHVNPVHNEHAISNGQLSDVGPRSGTLDALEALLNLSVNVLQPTGSGMLFAIGESGQVLATPVNAPECNNKSKKNKRSRYSTRRLGIISRTPKEEEIKDNEGYVNEDTDISFSTVATINDDDTVAEGYSDAVQQRSPITKTIETTTNYDGAPTVYPIETTTETADVLFNKPSDKEVEHTTEFEDATSSASGTNRKSDKFNDPAFNEALRLLLRGEKIWESCRDVTSNKDNDDDVSLGEQPVPSASVHSVDSGSSVPSIVITGVEDLDATQVSLGFGSNSSSGSGPSTPSPLSHSRMDKAKRFLSVAPMAYTKKQRERLMNSVSRRSSTPPPPPSPALLAAKMIARARSPTVSVSHNPTGTPIVVSVSVDTHIHVDEASQRNKGSVLGNNIPDLEAGIPISNNTPNTRRFSLPTVFKENVYASWDIEANTSKTEIDDDLPVDSVKRPSIFSATRAVFGNLTTNVNLARAMSMRMGGRGVKDLMGDDLESGMRGGIDMRW